jgi:hypothetical protein
VKEQSISGLACNSRQALFKGLDCAGFRQADPIHCLLSKVQLERSAILSHYRHVLELRARWEGHITDAWARSTVSYNHSPQLFIYERPRTEIFIQRPPVHEIEYQLSENVGQKMAIDLASMMITHDMIVS